MHTVTYRERRLLTLLRRLDGHGRQRLFHIAMKIVNARAASAPDGPANDNTLPHEETAGG